MCRKEPEDPAVSPQFLIRMQLGRLNRPERLANLTFSLPLLLIGCIGLVLFIVTGLASFIPWVASGPFALVFLGLMVAQFREYFQSPKSKLKPPPSGIHANHSIEETQLVSSQSPRRIWTYLVTTATFGAGAILSFIIAFAALTIVLGSLAVVSLLLLSRQIVSLSQQAEVTTEQIMSLTKLAKAAARAETKPTVTVDSPEFEDAPVIESQSFKVYNAYLSKGDILTIEAGADDWIRVELVSLTESAKLEAGKKYEWERGKEGKNLTVEYEARRNGNWKIYIFNLAKTQLEVGVTLTVEQ